MSGKWAILYQRSLKIKYILYVFWVLMMVLMTRLFYLQIDKNSVFVNLGTKNFLRIELIPPLRGDVYDCNHVLLAANKPLFDLQWYGIGKPKLTEHDEMILAKAGAIVGIDFSEPERHIAIAHAEKYARRLVLSQNLNFDQLCQISEQCADAEHLVITNRFQRIYPYHELASHVLGYLNRGEHSGQAGLELEFDTMLQGQQGRLLQVINSTGKTLAQRIYQEAKAGQDIVLTLDFEFQQLAEKLFHDGQAGAFILMDPFDGAIKALASYPRFDPNMFLNPISQDDWDKLTTNNPLINRATCALYPPASTFKLVTWAAGLEENVIDQHDEVFCNGYVTFCGRRYYCQHHLGHGALSPKEALVVSCNIPCFRMAKKLKVDCIASYARRFGLGRKTNFLLPEKDGLVPTTHWKKETKGERWWKGETLSVSIGQSYLLVTPLQLARMVGAICTGYLVKPRLLETELVEKEPLRVSGATLTFLRGAMKEVVSDGTGRMLKNLSAFDIYAKTGTAQICSLDKEITNKSLLEHGWLVGYFSYRGQRPLVMLVLLEHEGSSHFAIEGAYRFFRGYQNLMQEKQLRESDKSSIL